MGILKLEEEDECSPPPWLLMEGTSWGEVPFKSLTYNILFLCTGECMLIDLTGTCVAPLTP